MQTTFDAIFDSESKILILGSFPSVLSFKQNFYYGNPRNRFWQMMQNFFDVQLETVQQKKEFLIKNHIALWDIVLVGENKNGDKPSSLDSNLQCVQVADIDFVLKNSKVSKILLNGQKAYSLFAKNFPHLLNIAKVMPSTSPANTRFDLKVWESELSFLMKKFKKIV